MFFFKSFWIISIITIFGCNKIRKYRINIVNETGVHINKLDIEGTTDYNFSIEKDGETGVKNIEWKGPRSYSAGEHCFSYFVYSFSNQDSTYNVASPCGGCVVVKDLSQKDLNILTLKKVDPGESTCEHYFKIDY